MEQHEIIPSAYQRKDSSMDLIRHRTGWILRSINGLAYFWHPTQSSWTLAHTIQNLDGYEMPLEDGLKLLGSIPNPT